MASPDTAGAAATPDPGRPRCRAVLFDLDGTLLDSAPDLAAAVNAMRLARGQPPVAPARLREHAGSGARGMLREAMGRHPHDPDYAALRDEFLDRYAALLPGTAVPFDGVAATLAALAASGLAWGIVTNKALRLAQPLAGAFDSLSGAAVLVGGDSTPHAKPHPAPLLEAARRLAVAPAACVYVGDDERDIAAGRAAGMATLAAAWGYTGGSSCPPPQWGADAVIDHPTGLLKWLELA